MRSETPAAREQPARTLPREYFTSPELFREELRRIFHRRWVCALRVEEIPERGDFRVVSVGGESVVIVRSDARIHGFHNVCRHRGARLCEAPEGRFSKTIRCAYHAWTYGLDGRLLAAPTMDGLPGFERTDHPLHEVGVETWAGFVFVNLDPSAEPLEQWLAPLVGRVARFNLPELRTRRRIEYDVAANWKFIFQNYSECLHCPTIHPELSRRSPYTSGENDLVQGPFLGGFMTVTDEGGQLTVSGRACAPLVGPLPPEDLGRVYYYSVFPNLLLSLHADYVLVHTLSPQAPDRTRIACDWLFHPEADDDPGFHPEDAVEFWDLTNRQDWRVCELNQAGVTSIAYTPGPYSPREGLPAAWDREYLRQLRAGSTRRETAARRAARFGGR